MLCIEPFHPSIDRVYYIYYTTVNLFLSKQLSKRCITGLQSCYKTEHAAAPPPTQPPTLLRTANMVYVKKGGQLPPLVPPYDGPYRVLEKGTKFFKVDIGGKEVSVTVDCLKPHTGAAAASPAAPAKHSRPPNTCMPAPPANIDSDSEEAFSTPSSTPARSPSPWLTATTAARPARERRPPARLDL